MNNRRLFITLFLATGVALFALILGTSAFRYRTVRSFAATGINYDSRAINQPLFSIKHFIEHKVGSAKSIEIAFDMKVFSIDAGDNDVFQTAPLNDGLLLKLTRPASMALIAATDQPPGWKVYGISGTLEPGTWHHFYLSVDPTDRIIIRLDGKTIVDAPDTELSYSISDIEFGSGFNISSKFDGEIHNASIRYDLFQPNGVAKSPLVLIFEALLFFANLLCLFLLSGDDTVARPLVGT